MSLDYGGRKVIFKALVGSHNYNLATEGSDEDYKVFVCPTFEDLYYGKQFAKSVIGKEKDLDIHDIRKLVNLFFKANLNFIEVLYTNKISYAGDGRLVKFINSIYDMREELVTMNLPYLYKACGGMYFNKINLLDKGTEGTQHLVKQYEYDTKQAMHAYRPLDFCVRFEQSGFSDFKGAMAYNDEERKFLLGIKSGDFKRQEYLDFVMDYKEKNFNPLEEKYLSQPIKNDVKEKLEQLIFDYIKETLFI